MRIASDGREEEEEKEEEEEGELIRYWQTDFFFVSKQVWNTRKPTTLAASAIQLQHSCHLHQPLTKGATGKVTTPEHEHNTSSQVIYSHH